MSKINVEIDVIEACVSLNAITEIMYIAERVAKHNKKHKEHQAAIEVLKSTILEAVEEQATAEEMRAAREIIEE